MSIRHLIAAALSAGAIFAAQAADETPLTDCVELDGHQEIVRSGGPGSFLLHDGDANYVVSLRGDCGSLATTSRIEISTDGTPDRLCAKDTRVKTSRETCQVSKVEPIDAEQFAARKKRASR